MEPTRIAGRGAVISAGMTLRAVGHGTVVVLTPAGRLDLSTYEEFHDGNLRQVAEQPSGGVVVLGAGFELGSDPLTRVFATDASLIVRLHLVTDR